jgi:tryptophan synthase alpha chain
MASLGRPYLYAALRAGITGSATEVGEETKSFLAAAGAGGSRVLGGFGIRTGNQARAVAPYAHAVVAGSVFVNAVADVVAAQSSGRSADYAGSPRVRDEAIRRAVREKAEEITRG